MEKAILDILAIGIVMLVAIGLCYLSELTIKRFGSRPEMSIISILGTAIAVCIIGIEPFAFLGAYKLAVVTTILETKRKQRK